MVMSWYSRLLLRAAGANTWLLVLIVLTHLVGQISLMLALLLPLKVIILLGSDHIPSYFPGFLKGFEKESLVIGLTACAGCFYLVNAVCGNLGSRLIRHFANDVIGSGGEFLSTTTQVDVARDALRVFADSLAALSFSFLAFVALTLIYPLLAAMVLAVVAVGVSVTVAMSRISDNLNRYLDDNPDSLTRPFYAVGFLSCFVFIVGDFLLSSNPPSMLFAIVGFILSRQLFAGARSAFNRIGGLIKRAESVSSMLLVEQKGQSKPQREENRFWSYVGPETRKIWSSRLLQSAGFDTVVGDLDWFQGSTRGICLFTTGGAAKSDQDLLLKVFSASLRHYGEREEILLNQYEEFPLSPKLLEVHDEDDFRCHLFRWGDYRKIAGAERVALKRKFLSRSMFLTPTAAMVESDSRSKLCFADRLANLDFDRLRVAAVSSSEAVQIDLLECRIPWLIRLAKIAPLEIFKPRLPDSELVIAEDGEILATGWGDWSLEPVGAAWQKGPGENHLLLDAYRDAQAVRPDCAAFPAELMLATGLMWDLAHAYQQQRFSDVLEMLPAVLEASQDAEAPRSVSG